MPIRSDGEEKRERILKAAAEAFGKRGFRHATNQEISANSGANSAAISYYFRDKAGLYRDTWAFLQARSADKYLSWLAEASRPEHPPLKGAAREAELNRLRRLCKSLFDWMHDEECGDSEILRYEITDPTGELDDPCRDAVAWPLRCEIAASLAILLHVAPDSLSVVLGAEGLVARFRAGFQADRADTGAWSVEERFETIYSSFLRSVGLQENGAAAKAAKRASGDSEHPELGVTDEVDPFTLKPLTRLDLLLMQKAEHDGRKAAKRQDDPPETDADEEPDDGSQLQLW